MPFVSTEEKDNDVFHLLDQIEKLLIYPILTAKFKKEVEENLKAGYEDFLIYREYSTDFKNGEEKGQIIPHLAWGGSDKGFKISANNIIDVLDTISYVMDTNEGDVFYFSCESPDMGYPRINTVEETKREYEDTIRELQQPGEFVLDTFYDR